MVQIPRWQAILVLVILALGIAYALPNVLPKYQGDELPSWFPQRQIHLGLDLQGGAHLLAEVDHRSAHKQRLEDLVGGLREELAKLRKDGVRYVNLGVQGDGAGFDLTDPAHLDLAREAARRVAVGFDLTVEDDTKIRLSLSETAYTAWLASLVNQTIEVIRRRVDELGTTEPTIIRSGDDRIIIQLPGVGDTDRAKAVIGQTAAMTFQFVEENVDPDGVVPRSMEILPEALTAEELAAGRLPARFVVSKLVMVKGENLTDAQGSFQDAQPVVAFTFDTVGAKRFGDATAKNVGRLFAIVLDGEVISAPVIRSPILGGNGIISGSFTVQSANDLALLLRAGALPASLEYLEERSVGPGLGADSIAAGKVASLLGVIFVVIFMAFTYGRFGLFADVALLANLVLMAAILSGLQATLTLPGIAGIVLTIGMAVDANVLIFERIREETQINGRSPLTAVDAGYRRAMTTIIDSNLTTLIAAVLLFQFGTGPVKGFAVTLSIGLVTSMFTSIMLTRLLIVLWLRRSRPQVLGI